jgi:hypothetical protein
MATIAKQENIRRSERIVAGLQRASEAQWFKVGASAGQHRESSRTTLWRRRNRVA